MKTTVRITKQYEHDLGTNVSDISFTGDDMEDAMYLAMERDWGVDNWMYVMVANSICNSHFTEKGRKVLQEFLRIENPQAGICIESIRQMYEMALEPVEPDE